MNRSEHANSRIGTAMGMIDKDAILAAVKSGELTVEQAVSRLKQLQQQGDASQGEPIMYRPQWQAVAGQPRQQTRPVLLITDDWQQLEACRQQPPAQVVFWNGTQWQWFEQIDGTVRQSRASLDELLALIEDLPQRFDGVFLMTAAVAGSLDFIATSLLQLVQGLAAFESARPSRWVMSVTGAWGAACCEALAGFVRAARVEYPQFEASVLLPGDESPAITVLLTEIAFQAHQVEVRYQNRERQVLRLQPAAVNTSGSVAWLADDVQVLITGGNGELARALASHLLAHGRVKITLLGRSAAAEPTQQLLQRFPERLRYVQADITDLAALQPALVEATAQFGPRLVLIHCAGVLADSFISRGKPEQLQRVMAPKYQGITRLLTALEPYSLQGVVLFSSIAAYLPHSGQSFYALANRAMAAAAIHQLAADIPLQTIHWPLWDGGGMDISAEDKRLMLQETGMTPMPQASGWQFMLTAGAGNYLLAHGLSEQVTAFIAGKDALAPAASVTAGHDPQWVEQRIVEALCEATRFPAHKVKPRLSLQAMGLDSMIITRLNVTLEKLFGALPKTLLFDCQNVAELTSAVLSRVALQDPAESPANASPVSPLTAEVLPPATMTAANPPATVTSTVNQRDVAIIGLAGRYPGAADLSEFWQNLLDGVDSVTEIPADRWPLEDFYRPDKTPGFSYSKWGGFIEEIDAFDPLFFAISPREAESIDPQERLFLQEVWHALEDAGYSPQRLQECSRGEQPRDHQTGVYVGVTSGQYQLLSAQDWGRGERRLSSSAYWSMANRISFFLNLQGPSLAVDTACSASLTAITLGYEALAAGRIKMAIVGGVNVNIDPSRYVALSEMGFLSTDGKCRSFGQGGDGFVPAEGIGAAILKPLADAQRDHDRIYAVIKGAASNHSGTTNGYSVPSPQSQALLVQRALKDANVPASQISCIETHGTGTALGDPIEVEGLTQAFRMSSPDIPAGHCVLSSVKSNIGHLESAAGIAGLTKLALQLHHQTLVPSLHSQPLNPALNLAATPFTVQTRCQPWPASGQQLRTAGLSSFGAGGSNAHLIVQQAPERITTARSKTVAVPLALYSANNPAGLERLCRAHLECLQAPSPQWSLADYLYSLQVGRAALSTRLALPAQSVEQLIEQLREIQQNGLKQDARVKRLLDHEIDDEAVAPDTNVPEELARQWLQGSCLRWSSLWQDSGAEFMTLPLYPFARLKLWYRPRPEMAEPEMAEPTAGVPSCEPVDDQQLRWQLPLNTPVLADHVIQGRAILSGMGHLSMVLASLKQLRMVAADLDAGYQFTAVHWLRPLAAKSGALEFTVELRQQAEEIHFRIKNAADELASFGRFSLLADAMPNNESSVSDQPVDSQQQHCSGAELYRDMAAVGFNYGPYYQGLKQLHFGTRNVRFELASVTQPDAFPAGYIDSMLQGIFTLHRQRDTTPAIPFKAARIRVWQKPSSVVAGTVSVLSPQSSSEQNGEHVYHISGVTEGGQTGIEFDRFVSRSVDQPDDQTGTGILAHCYLPTWVAQTQPEMLKVLRPGSRHVVVRSDDDSVAQTELLTALTRAYQHQLIQSLHTVPLHQLTTANESLQQADHIWFLAGLYPKRYCLADGEFVQDRLQASLFGFLTLTQALLRHRGREQTLLLLTNNAFRVLDNEVNFNPLAAGLVAFAKSLSNEAGHLHLYQLDICADEPNTTVEPDQLFLADSRLHACTAALRQGRFYAEKFAPFEQHATTSSLPPAFRHHGVYLIIGGAGGLGLATARYLQQHCQARVILAGRRSHASIDAGIVGDFDYRQCDINQPDSTKALIQSVLRDYGELHGVIHSALILNDTTIANMSADDLQAALSVKVTGTIHLMEALIPVALDFILFYSSSISQTCGPGQANYAAGSLMQDALAGYYSRMLDGIRVINWGFWHQIGVVADEFYRQRMSRKGLIGIDLDEGLVVLNRILSGDEPQIVALKLNQQGMDKWQPYLTNVAQEVVVEPHQNREGNGQSLTAIWASLKPEFNYQKALLLNRYCHARMLALLQQQQLFLHAGQVFSEAQICQALSMQPGFESLLRAMLAMLERGGILVAEGGGWALAATDMQAISREQVLAVNPHAQGHIRLLDHCLQQLPELLAGHKSDTEILFPGGSAELVQALYRDNPISDACNEMVAEAVNQQIEALLAAGQERIHIIEIGAGTGSTTQRVLARIRGHQHRLVYHFTDLSSHFVAQARRTLVPEYPFVQAGIFDVAAADIEQERQRAGIERCDILLASNVLHATADIDSTLRNCTRILTTGARLIINEVTENWDFVTMTFGLTKGWWLYRDGERRMPHSPLLSCDMWQQALSRCGLKQLQFFGGGAAFSSAEQEALGQTVMVAEVSEMVAATAAVTVSTAAEASSSRAAVNAVVDDGLRQYLLSTFAKVLKIPVDELDEHESFQAFGLDSIILPEILNGLQERYPQLTLEQLAGIDSIAEVAAMIGASISDTTPVTPAAQQPQQNTYAQQSIQRTEVLRSEPLPVVQQPVVTPSPMPDRVPEQQVAIVGLAGYYPHADDMPAFWQQLCQSGPLGGPMPAARRHSDAGYAGHNNHDHYATWLTGVDEFDSLFFGISPREAPQLDPQQRLMLEVCWHALEDAGYHPDTLAAGKNHFGGQSAVGVFMASMYQHYGQLAAGYWAQGKPVAAESGLWALANRVSHSLGLTGPSMGVDSACSGALSAIKLACDAIRSGECAAAIAGGVNLILHPGHHQGLQQARMLAEGMECHPFDSSAGSGMLTGEGAGAVLLKPYQQAVADGDHIYGVIVAAASNFKGQTHDGFAAPDSAAESALMSQALARAGIDIDRLDYLEVSATGVPRGDAAESEAIARFVDVSGKRTPTMLGTVKRQYGHLEAASGMAQLSRVLLQFEHRQWLPSPGAQVPPELAQRQCHFNDRLRDWEHPDRPCYAAINAFAAGGSNVHLILRSEVTATADSGHHDDINRVIPLSARKPEQLQTMVQRLCERLQGQDIQDIAKVAFTLQRGRRSFKYRVLFVADSVNDLLRQAEIWLAQKQSAQTDVSVLSGSLQTDAQQWLAGAEINWLRHYSGSVPGVLPLPGYPFARQSYWLTPETSVPQSASVHDQQSHSQPVLSTSQQASPMVNAADQSRMTRTIMTLIAEQQSIPLAEIEPDGRFEEFGFDSISYVELAEKLQQALQLNVDATVFYQCTNIPQLSRWLADQQPDQVVVSPPLPAAAEAVKPPMPEVSAVSVPTQSQTNERDIAIIGMSGRFPGSEDLEAFWQHLLSGDQLVTAIPDSRFDASGIRVDETGTTYNSGGFLDHIDQFDNEFFQISPREARLMDPQHRLMLQTVYQVIADAGYHHKHLAGSDTGIFVGVGANSYGQLLMDCGEEVDGLLATGNVHSVLVNRISFLLDINGPSEPVNTACSSSLVAVHRAVQAIRNGECQSALVGGVNLIMDSTGHEAFAKSGMLSASGQCHTFDARADGYTRGEGCAALWLKPLAQALADGDHVYACIKGSAVGHGGRATSLTAPNLHAQARVIRQALQDARITADQVSYVETHGTGTALGDPVEINALKTVFGDSDMPCAIGAVKTNIGHLETAAGIAGLIKTVLCLQHQLIPAISGLKEVNPLVDLSRSSLYLNQSLTHWRTAPGLPRTAGISSFGFGGVNAHVIVTEAALPEIPEYSGFEGPCIATFSALSDTRLRAFVQHFRTWLGHQQQIRLADICFTLQSARSQDPCRLACVVCDVHELVAAMDSYLQGQHDEMTGVYVSGTDQTALNRLLDPADLSSVVDNVVRQQNWDKLARLWVSQVPVALPCQNDGRRISIPAVPFEEKSYWPNPAGKQSSIGKQNSTAAPETVEPARQSAPEVAAPAPVAAVESSQPVPAVANVTVEPAEPAPVAAAVIVSASEPASPLSFRQQIEQQLSTIIREALDISSEAMRADKAFPEYGIDSIIGLRIMQKVQQRYGDNISMSAIIEEPTVARLSAYIEEHTTVEADRSEVPAVAGKREVINVRLTRFGTSASNTVWLFLPDVSGELTWALNWMNHSQDVQMFGLEWRLNDRIGSMAELLTAITNNVSAIQADELVILTKGHMAGFAVGLAQTIQQQLDSAIHLKFIDPKNVSGLEQTTYLAELANTCAVVWTGRLNEQLATLNEAQLIHEIQRMAEEVMPRTAFDGWFDGLMTTVQWSLPLLRQYQPPVWVNAHDSEIVLSYEAEEINLAKVLVPPAIVLRLNTTECLSMLAVEQYQQIYTVQPPSQQHDFPLVFVNREGTHTPTFWVHTLFGDVSFTLNLAHHLGKACPVLGIEQFTVEGELHLLPTIEQMASHYIESIQTERPKGPYIIGGYSFGGVVAYEMCRQLTAQGKAVEKLIMIDSFMPNTDTFNAIDISNVEVENFDVMALLLVANNFGRRFKIDAELKLEHVDGMPLSQQIDVVSRFLQTGKTNLGYQEIYQLVENNYNTILTNNDALLSYQPKPLADSVEVLMFHATQGFIAKDNIYGMPEVRINVEDRTNGFASYVSGNMHIIDVEADHYSICHDRKLIEISKTILDDMADARSARSSGQNR
ncbi:SDR family NAD(P)-dependent oxidoreductase [Gynuella sunshinyii]|uniref:PKS n=1 Tax=Gynuella sunshinyii YC6258 TaxID=1445510 RepID=A0A0C5VZE5_9GAMM|nr:SDR family NAD(P)-dependent oxidoreductase [Gynuella sunshinyii]AJQ95774.1 polyketide synthase modules-related protein [Gynuella sunshinyii YC6258]DAC80063.1 TPA_exp: PKS [Gynuella sunshinyii YC6258]